VEQTVADILLTRASMNGDNVLKLLSRTMGDILNIFSNNMNDFTVSTGERIVKIGQYLAK